MSEPSNRGDLAYETVVSPEDNNKCQSCKSNSIMNNCKRTKDMHTVLLDSDESTVRTEDETDDESLKLGPGFGSLYLTSNSSLSDTGTYNSSPLDPTRVRSSSGLTSIDEVVDRVAADREVWRRKSLLVDNDDDQHDDYPSDEEGGIKSSLAKKLSYGDDNSRDTYKRTYPASFHFSTKLETNSSFEEPLSCREKFDQVCVFMSNYNLYVRMLI